MEERDPTHQQNTRRAGESDSPNDIFEDGRRVVEDVQHLREDVSQAYSRLKDKDTFSVKKYYDENPYAVLAAAAGAGYVLGGGLFTPFTKRLVRIGVKALVAPIAMNRLQELTESEGGLPGGE